MMLDLQHELRLYLGVYERELWSSYRLLLKPGMRTFDIGGRDGYSALILAKKTGAEVISFECESAAIPAMQRVFDQNPYPIKAVQGYVGRPGDIRTTITVDDAARRYFMPDFLKIDVEGGEAAVLEGAIRTIKEHRPAMIVEVHGKLEEQSCIGLLSQHDYDIAIIDRARFLREERPLPHNRWLVCKARPAVVA
jgi:hypothetical protein